MTPVAVAFLTRGVCGPHPWAIFPESVPRHCRESTPGTRSRRNFSKCHSGPSPHRGVHCDSCPSLTTALGGSFGLAPVPGPLGAPPTSPRPPPEWPSSSAPPRDVRPSSAHPSLAHGPAPSDPDDYPAESQSVQGSSRAKDLASSGHAMAFH